VQETRPSHHQLVGIYLRRVSILIHRLGISANRSDRHLRQYRASGASLWQTRPYCRERRELRRSSWQDILGMSWRQRSQYKCIDKGCFGEKTATCNSKSTLQHRD